MKYIPSIAFEEMSGSAKGVTAAKTRGTWFLQAILQHGRPWSGIRRIRRTSNSRRRLLGRMDSF